MAVNTIKEQNAGAATQRAKKTMKDLALERLKSRHPDTEYADDEAIYGAINYDYDADQKALGDYKANEEKLANMMSADPKAAVFLQAMMGGKNPYVELVRNFGEDAIDYFSDPENQDEIAAASAEFVQKKGATDELEKEYNKNMEESYGVFDKFEDAHGEDVTNEIIGAAMQDANNIIRGKFTEDMLNMYLKAKNYDSDVADAAHEGEVRGKNSKHIENLKLKKKGDGTADLDSANAAADNRGDNQPDLGALGRATRRGSIWERGGEKRTHNR